MGTAARKARKRAGIKFEREPKRPTRPYESKSDRQKRVSRQAKLINESVEKLKAKRRLREAEKGATE